MRLNTTNCLIFCNFAGRKCDCQILTDELNIMEDIRKTLPDWAFEMNCAVTVCDAEGTVLYMNEKALETFAKHGDMRGRNLIPCHNEDSVRKIRHMLETGESNAYTITKNGVRKMIYQTPWRVDGKIAGLVEISMVIPAEMPHYDRDKA